MKGVGKTARATQTQVTSDASAAGGSKKTDGKARVGDQTTTQSVRAGGLAATAQLAPEQKIELQAARFGQIQNIPARYEVPSGPLGITMNKALDASISSMLFRMGAPANNPEARAHALLYVANDTISKQQALIDGTDKSLEGKSPSEVAEKQSLARSLLGVLSERLFATFDKDALVRAVPEDVILLLQPATEAQASALAIQARFEAERQELSQLLRGIQSAAEAGMKVDTADSLLYGAARKALDLEPGPAIETIMPLFERSRAHMDELEAKKRAMANAKAQAAGKPLPFPPEPSDAKEISPAAFAARVEKNMKKVEVRLAELRDSVKDAPLPNMVERFEGAMLGLAVADCLGSTTEFMPREDIRFEFGMNVDLVGGGAFNWKPGEPTDDTQMALAMARSIVKQGGFDQVDVSKNFVGWYDQKPKDIGGLTRQTLGFIKHGVEPEVAGFTPWAFGGFDNAGNGSVMRAAPVALLTAFMDDDQLVKTAHASSAMTHADPRCTWGTAAMCKGMQLVLAGASDVTAKVAAWLEDKNPSLATALKDVPKLKPEDVKTTGFVVDTVQAAFYALERFDNYVDAAAFLANHGEDTDTAGATGGMLLGAKFGVKAIPEAWSSKVIGAGELRTLAQNIHQLATA